MPSTYFPEKLTPETMLQGATYLSAVDPDLANIYASLGLPPLWDRKPGFLTLVHIILEQQVSLASAKAAFMKLQAAAGVVTPETFLRYNDDELKGFGFSRQKTTYCRGLAQSILNSEIDLGNLHTMDDASVHSALLNLKGIGPWTADIYLLMVLLRPDSWPSGDLALAVAVQEIKKLPHRPSPQELELIAAPWRPWRAVAARLLWHFYLSKRLRPA